MREKKRDSEKRIYLAFGNKNKSPLDYVEIYIYICIYIYVYIYMESVSY